MELFDILEQVRSRAPLIQCITNFVTVNDCANILLAAGASPTMAQDIREVEEAVTDADGLVCNLGAIDLVDSMILAGKRANELGIPVVLDVVIQIGLVVLQIACADLGGQSHGHCHGHSHGTANLGQELLVILLSHNFNLLFIL